MALSLAGVLSWKLLVASDSGFLAGDWSVGLRG